MIPTQLNRAINIGIRAALQYISNEAEITQHQAHTTYGKAQTERAIKSGQIRFRKVNPESKLGRVYLNYGDCIKNLKARKKF